MKTLRQIIEGAVVMSDFKLDRKGRKYKAHRMSMGDDMKEDSNPYTKVYEADTFTKTLPRMGNKALDTAKGLISPYEKAMSDMSPGSDYYKKNIENNPEAKAKVDDFMKSAPKASELDSSIDKTKQKFNKALTNKGTVGDSVEEDTSIMRSKESQGVKRLPTVREIEKADRKEIEGQFTDKAAETESPFNNRTDVYNKPSKGSKVVNKLADFESVSFSTFSRTSVLDEAGDRETMNKERSRVLAKFIKGATPKNGQVVNNIDTSGEVTESIEQVNELNKSTLRSYLKKAVPSHGDEEFISRVSKDPEEKAISKRIAGNRAVGIIRANRGLKSAHVATMKENTDPHEELDEARGRPAGAATLAKRAAAASKPREDDDEGEHYDSDSGVEADQHIHVQLKKAADSDQKPFEVSFRNGKKHSVSQKVAKDVLSATERLKPEHRKNVHDEIHQSYDNLMSVHRLIARR